MAYRFGALFLAEAPPGGPGRPDLAIALLEKGDARAAGATGSLAPGIGFVHYWSLSGLRRGGRLVQRAARLPGAPIWLEPLAAVTLAEGGNRTASRLLWQQILQQRRPTTGSAREAERRLKQLDAMDQIDTLRRRRRDVTSARQGRPPADWAELVRAGYLRGTVADPDRRARIGSTRGVVVARPGLAAAARCRRKPRRAVSELPLTLVAVRLRGVRPRRRQLSQRLHLPAAAASSRSSGRRRTARRASATLAWYENMPVVGWLALGGTCRTCKAPHQRRCIPIVELVTGALFVGGYLLYGLTPLLRSCASRSRCAMIVLFVIDLRHRILPNVITVPGIADRLRAEPVPAARLARVAHRPACSAAACSSRSARRTTGCAASKGSAWAT